MGNKSVLAEALNEEQQNILASLMKVTHSLSCDTSQIHTFCLQEAEKYFMDPVLSYWMSGLQRDGDDAPSWTWAHCKSQQKAALI